MLTVSDLQNEFAVEVVEQLEQERSSAPASLMMIASVAIIGVIDNSVIRSAETIGLWQVHLGRALLMLP